MKKILTIALLGTCLIAGTESREANAVSCSAFGEINCSSYTGKKFVEVCTKWKPGTQPGAACSVRVGCKNGIYTEEQVQCDDPGTPPVGHPNPPPPPPPPPGNPGPGDGGHPGGTVGGPISEPVDGGNSSGGILCLVHCPGPLLVSCAQPYCPAH